VLTTLGEAAAGALDDDVEDGVLAGWFVWIEQATNRRAVVAALVTATIAVCMNRLTPGD
jgi:hypothetical protein